MAMFTPAEPLANMIALSRNRIGALFDDVMTDP
jgi:hypothetical protein